MIQTSDIADNTWAHVSLYSCMSPAVLRNFTSKISYKSSSLQISIVQPALPLEHSKVARFFEKVTLSEVRACDIS